MKFTLSWLKEHLETNLSLEQMCDALVDLGIEVESIENKAKGLEPFVIVQILDVAKHPNADKLRLCKVTDGKTTYDVVCGAPNVYQNMKTVFADIGTYVPGLNMTLKKAEIRGVPSNGMLCSSQELGLEGDEKGIIDLGKNAPTGQRLVDYLGLTDPIIDVSVTPNRPDWLSVRGIARDLAAKQLGTIKKLPLKTLPSSTSHAPFKVNLDFKEDQPACSLFEGRFIKGVKNGESPDWLKRKLTSIGLRPISALVDITNYLTHDLCRPLHIFDADKIKGDLSLRFSRQGETLEALDNKTYTLDNNMVVIADKTGVISLGGIIGGISTSCETTTQNVFLEAALFDPIVTAQTGRKLGILSDARYRFERGIDPKSVRLGIDYGTQLILDLCGGESSEIVTAGSEPTILEPIAFRPNRFTQLTGIELPKDKIIQIFKNLECGVQEQKEKILITPPSWRLDLQTEIDLIEDLLRLHGYDHLEIQSLPKEQGIPKAILTQSQKRRQDARRYLATRGITEIVSYSFMSQKKASLFTELNKHLVLSNPISADLDYMRPSIFPNLLDALSRNESRDAKDLSLFEIGPIYLDDSEHGQMTLASGIRMGKTNPKHWLANQRAWDVFDIKADILGLFAQLGLKEDQVQFKQQAPSYLHPGRSGSYYFAGKTLLASFGQIHPRIQKEFGLNQPCLGFEIFLDRLPSFEKKKNKIPFELSPYQIVSRDFAFILDKDIAAQDVIKFAKTIDKSLIQDVSLFDLYEGDKLPQGKKSLAINLKLQAKDRTLQEGDIETLSEKLITGMKEKFQGMIRDH